MRQDAEVTQQLADEAAARTRARNAAGPREETSLLGFVNVLLRYRLVIAVCTILAAAVVAATASLAPPTYSVRASFTSPGGAAVVARMNTISERLGLSFTIGGDAARSAAFYSDLVTARPILGAVAAKEYTFERNGRAARGSLAEAFGIRSANPAHQRDMVIQRLASMISAGVTSRSGIVEMLVLGPDPLLSQQVANNILAELNAFNVQRRHAEAAAERGFAEEQLAEARARLRSAEEDLRRFSEANRDRTSPQLSLEYNRLNNEITRRQELYTSLSNVYERARLAEVRELPDVIVLEQPDIPLRADTRETARKTLLGAIGGLFIGILLAFARERAAEAREGQTPSYRRYRQLKEDAKNDLRRPLKPVRELLGGRSD